MALTKANALAEVRRLINEPTENVFSDAQIGDATDVRSWLDRGARCTSSITLCEPASESEALVASTIHYTLATHFIKVTAVMLTNSDGTALQEGLQHFDIRGLGNVTDATLGKPRFWYKHGQTLLIYPAPSATYGGATYNVTVYGYVCVDDYSTTGVNLPDYLNYYAVKYAVAQAYIKDGKHAKAAQEMQSFMRGCMFHRRDKIDQIEYPDTVDMRMIPDITLPAQQ